MEVQKEVRQLAEPLAEEAGYELVDVEQAYQGHHRIVRVLLDKPGGITIGDCATFSRRLAECLDMNQIVTGSYQLEVSSPGIDRPLRTLGAVERFAGNRVALTTYEPHNGRRKFEGRLIGVDRGLAGVRTDDGAEHWFDWPAVKSAHLVVDPWAEVRRRTRGNGDRRRTDAPGGSGPERGGTG
jgi:ribosome maturation factor RimP